MATTTQVKTRRRGTGKGKNKQITLSAHPYDLTYVFPGQRRAKTEQISVIWEAYSMFDGSPDHKVGVLRDGLAKIVADGAIILDMVAVNQERGGGKRCGFRFVIPYKKRTMPAPNYLQCFTMAPIKGRELIVRLEEHQLATNSDYIDLLARIHRHLRAMLEPSTLGMAEKDIVELERQQDECALIRLMCGSKLTKTVALLEDAMELGW